MPPQAAAAPKSDVELALQARVASVAQWAACNSAIEVTVTSEGPPACALGFRFGHLLIGKIRVHSTLLRLLSQHQLDYVLAHEVGHIYMSHVLPRAGLAGIRALYEELALDDPTFRWMLLGWDLVKTVTGARGGLPPAESLTKEQEIDADNFAIRYQQHYGHAESTLLLLVNNDLEQASHVWTVMTVNFPVMTIAERLAWLRLSGLPRSANTLRSI